jgi:hypothetical protein
MWSKILHISKWIAGVIGGATAIAGIVMFIYNTGIKHEKEVQKDTSLEKKVDMLIVSDSLKTVKLDQVLVNQSDFAANQFNMNSKLDRLNNSYINHLKTDQKLDQVIEYLEGEKKNNGLQGINLVLTPQEQKDIVIPLSIK